MLQQQQQRQYEGQGASANYGTSEFNRSEFDVFSAQLVCNMSQKNDCDEDESLNEVEWILDSSCTDHIINDASYYTSFENLRVPINVKVGDGRNIQATKVGKVLTNFITNNKKRDVMMNDVFYLKGWTRD